MRNEDASGSADTDDAHEIIVSNIRITGFDERKVDVVDSVKLIFKEVDKDVDFYNSKVENVANALKVELIC